MQAHYGIYPKPLFRSALDALTVVKDLQAGGVSLHLPDLRGDVSGDGLARGRVATAARRCCTWSSRSA